MAQRDGSRSDSRRQPAETQRGSSGSQGRDGAQYQQKDMGAHPAYGNQPAGKPAVRKTPDEDYGSRGLHHQAGTTKKESLEERGIGHAEDYDARYDAESSKPRTDARAGRPVAPGQTPEERQQASRREGASPEGQPRPGHGAVKEDAESGEGDIDISPGAAGGSLHSKRDPASR